MKRVVLSVLAVCMICFCFVGCNNTGKKQVKYVLYCGLNDAGTGYQVYSVADAQEAARKIITDKGSRLYRICYLRRIHGKRRSKRE